MANSAAILSTSLPLNKKLKPELQAIARALGITDNATVPSLRKSINEHIRNHAEIADDPRFLPLLAHRSGPKTVTKNSADKLAEEASEPGVPGQAATGANKTLLTNNVKTDPAPQFAKLSSGSRTGPITTDTKDDANEDCESTSSDSGSSISPEPEPESEEKPKKTPRQQLPRNLPVRAAIGVNGRILDAAMTHGCVGCTHLKRYRSDLIAEGAIFGGDQDVAGEETEENAAVINADGDDVQMKRIRALVCLLKQFELQSGSMAGYWMQR
ncbi:hypothetical protein B0H13DRAFT_2386304 [Mycena leptocephala]|nr:hypothetical protein B0H13DRAFT_2386304 [Mycena leptocephala]